MSRPYHHENLKNELLEHAIENLSQHGLESLSLRALAAQCGVSHNAIYRHFPNKEALIDCCRHYVTAELTNHLEQTMADFSGSDRERMATLCQAYMQFYEKHPTYFSALFRNTTSTVCITLAEVPDNYPPFEIFRRVCVSMIQKGILSAEEGLFRLSRCWATLHGLIALQIAPNVTFALDSPMDWKTIF